MSTWKDHTIIAAKTGAQATEIAFRAEGQFLPITIAALGLAGVEEVDVMISVDNGVNWTALPDITGAAVKLTATVQVKVLDTPGLYGFKKDLTAAAVAVMAFLS